MKHGEIIEHVAEGLKAKNLVKDWQPQVSLSIPDAKFQYRPDVVIECLDSRKLVCEQVGGEAYKTVFAEAVMCSLIPDVKGYAAILVGWKPNEIQGVRFRITFVRNKLRMELKVDCVSISDYYDTNPETLQQAEREISILLRELV